MGARRLLVAESAGDDHVVAASANGLVLSEISGADDGFADVQQLAIPPHLLGGSAAAYSRAKPLNQLFAIHPGPSHRRKAGPVPPLVSRDTTTPQDHAHTVTPRCWTLVLSYKGSLSSLSN